MHALILIDPEPAALDSRFRFRIREPLRVETAGYRDLMNLKVVVRAVLDAGGCGCGGRGRAGVRRSWCRARPPIAVALRTRTSPFVAAIPSMFTVVARPGAHRGPEVDLICLGREPDRPDLLRPGRHGLCQSAGHGRRDVDEVPNSPTSSRSSRPGPARARCRRCLRTVACVRAEVKDAGDSRFCLI